MKGKRKILFALTALLGFMLLLAAAACSPSRVKLSFETNGGAAVESVETTAGTVVPLPTPVREGYVFDGWYPDVDLSGEACGETVTAEKSATYYAKWTAGYRLTLDANGGTLSTAALWLREGDSLSKSAADWFPSAAPACNIAFLEDFLSLFVIENNIAFLELAHLSPVVSDGEPFGTSDNKFSAKFSNKVDTALFQTPIPSGLCISVFVFVFIPVKTIKER